MKVIIRYWMGGAGVVTDQQVVLLRQRRMERKTQQTSAVLVAYDGPLSVRDPVYPFGPKKWTPGRMARNGLGS